MRPCLLVLGLLAGNLSAVSAQGTFHYRHATRVQVARQQKHSSKPPKVQPLTLPKEISLILKVEDLPGIANPKSFWEGAYEIRVADWSDIVDKTTSAGAQPTGEVLLHSSFSKRSFIDKNDREVRLSIAVAGSLLERLQRQGQTAQGFLLRSTIRIFDAQLDQTRAFKLNRVWQSKLFPDGEATISISLKPDGSYSTWGPVPKDLPKGYTIVGAPRSEDHKP